MPSLRGAFDFPLTYADGEGRLPAFNDGPPATVYDGWRARLYEIGLTRYGDPRYAEVLAKVGRGSGIHGLVYGVAALPRTEPFTPGQDGSALLADRTLPVLRAGRGSGRLQVAVNGMAYVGGHTHPAQLEIELTFGPARLVPAPASIKYADPLHAGWYRQTVSHSTVVVGGKSQERGQRTEMVAFHAGALFQAARLRTSSAYPGAVLDRTVILTAAGLIDLFRVTAPAPATLDWVLHHAGVFSAELELLPRRAPPLPGYQELEEVSEGHADGDWRARWRAPDGGQTAFWMAGEAGTTTISGLGRIGASDQNNDPSSVSALIVRRQAAATTFLGALLPGDDGTAVVTALPAMRDGVPVAADEAAGLQIQMPGATWVVLLALGPAAYEIGGRQVAGGQILVERRDASGVQSEGVALG